MRTLVIGDLHFDNKPYGLLDAQKKCVKDIIDLTTKIDHIIFLGDLIMHRKPSPTVLLALQEAIDYASLKAEVTIIRGNHDSENKSDDGVTALSLFQKNTCQDTLPNPKNRRYRVRVVTQTLYDHRTKMVFIPHYEDEERIKKYLSEVPNGYTVFGHFGYRGCLNSAGDADSTLSLSDFQRKTYLGHIHHFKQDGLVTLLGTPYSTNFGEAGTKGYYLILHDSEEEFHQIESGPRHIVTTLEEVRGGLEYINDSAWFTLLRINLQPGESASDIPKDLNVSYLDIKLLPSFTDEDAISHYTPKRDLFIINDQIIEDYVDNSDVSPALTKDILMGGYNLLKKGHNED